MQRQAYASPRHCVHKGRVLRRREYPESWKRIACGTVPCAIVLNPLWVDAERSEAAGWGSCANLPAGERESAECAARPSAQTCRRDSRFSDSEYQVNSRVRAKRSLVDPDRIASPLYAEKISERDSIIAEFVARDSRITSRAVAINPPRPMALPLMLWIYFRFRRIADLAGFATGSTRSRMTHLGHRPAPLVAVAKPVSAPIKVIIGADTMLSPERWGGHEATGIHRPSRGNSGRLAARGARAAKRARTAHRSAHGHG